MASAAAFAVGSLTIPSSAQATSVIESSERSDGSVLFTLRGDDGPQRLRTAPSLEPPELNPRLLIIDEEGIESQSDICEQQSETTVSCGFAVGPLVVSLGAGDDQFEHPPFLWFESLIDVEAGPGDDIIRAGADRVVVRAGAGADSVFAYGGVLEVFGGSGDDRLNGGSGPDLLEGGPGSDRLAGGIGTDEIMGGRGRDSLFGGAGDDRLVGGPGADGFAGASGTDLVLAADRRRDRRVRCGPGRTDYAVVDRADRPITDGNCETRAELQQRGRSAR